MTELNQEETETYKIVNLSFTETASIIVKAETDDEAITAVQESFENIPDLKVVSIEDADPDLVAEVKQYRAEQEATEKKVIH